MYIRFLGSIFLLTLAYANDTAIDWEREKPKKPIEEPPLTPEEIEELQKESEDSKKKSEIAFYLPEVPKATAKEDNEPLTASSFKKPICEIHNFSSVYLSHKEGEGLGFNKGYTTLGSLMAPLLDWHVVPVFPFQFHIFNDGKLAFNGGLGARIALTDIDAVVSLFGHYDFRRLITHNFHQLGFGFEWIKPYWSVHFNGYFPVGSKTNVKKVDFLSDLLLYEETADVAMWGLDLLLGVDLYKNRKKSYNFTAYAGPYYYKGEFGDDAFGGKGRLFFQSRYWNLGVNLSVDKIFDTRVYGEIGLRFPCRKKLSDKISNLQKPVLCSLKPILRDKLNSSVQRQEIIVISEQKRRF